MNFRANGKLLLTGEYLVLDGARALALPTRAGQTLEIASHPRRGTRPCVRWNASDSGGPCWDEFRFYPDDATIESSFPEEASRLQKILVEARELNPFFLGGDLDVEVETHMEFSKEWGLGSSSTLLALVGQWAHVDPFELQRRTSGGSGYDIACAMSGGPIVYQRQNDVPSWSDVSLSPSLFSHLFFVFRGRKQVSSESIQRYRDQHRPRPQAIARLSDITDSLVLSSSIEEWASHLEEHERLMAMILETSRIQDELFSDFRGVVKSLGAWGGDFMLALSTENTDYVHRYFSSRGYATIIPWASMIQQRVNE